MALATGRDDGGDRRPGRGELLALGAILLLGLAARGLYLRQIAGAPDFAHPGVDAASHDYWARALATGDWTPPAGMDDPAIQRTPFFRPPGYPYFLAGVYRLSGCSPLAARLVQMALGLASAVLAFLIGRRWFVRGAGLVAAGGMAVYWAFIYFEGELHAPAVLIFLLLGSVYLLGRWSDSRRIGWAIAAGAVLGLGILVRPNVAVFALAAMAWAVWVALRRGDATRRVVAAAAAVILPAVAVTSVATIRNYVVAGDFVPVSSNAGINLFIGNNENATGEVAGEIAGLGEFRTCFDYPGIVRNLEGKLGRKMKHSEVSAWFSAQAWRFIRANPGRFTSLLGRKVCLLWGPVEVGHNKEVHFERRASALLRHLPGNFAIVLALAVVGAAMMVVAARGAKGGGDGTGLASPGRRDVPVLAALLVLVLSASLLPFFAAARYRVAIIPFLMLFAAEGAWRIWSLAAGRRFLQAGCWLAACAGGYLLVVLMPCQHKPRLAKWHYDRGASFRRAGQADQAEKAFEEALRVDPAYVPARYNLGVMLAERGRTDDAVRQWQQVLQTRADMPRPRTNIGMVLLRKGEIDAAIGHFQAALRARPDHALAHNGMGMAMASKGKLEEAMGHWRRAVELAPAMPEAHYNLGRALLAAEKLDEAAAHLTDALRGKPHYPRARYHLGMALLAAGDVGGAAEQFAALAGEGGWSAAYGRLGEALRGVGPAAALGRAYRQALSARTSFVLALNNVAWLMATCPRGDLRDGAEAVRLAEQACRATGRKQPRFLDTLAAAYAEAGRFDDAVQTVQEAMKLAGQTGPRTLVEKMRQRLGLYQVGRPCRSDG